MKVGDLIRWKEDGDIGIVYRLCDEDIFYIWFVSGDTLSLYENDLDEYEIFS